ncbi:MAG: histidine kinase, partial [Aquificota bacterium]
MSLLREFLNQVEEGYLLLDASGKVAFCNQFLLRRELVRENCEGKPFYECINNLTAISCVAQALSQGKKDMCQFYHGDRVYSMYVFLGSELTVVRFTDITDLKRYERSKKEFVANVSHELKTPIAVIKSILETLYQEEEKEEKREFIRKALKRVEDMQRLVEDLLIITKLESGEERLNKQEVFLKPLVDEVFELFTHKKVSLENLVEDDFKLYADEDKLFLLLKNLIDNAVKYNKEGGWVRVSARKEEPYGVIVVEDSG